MLQGKVPLQFSHLQNHSTEATAWCLASSHWRMVLSPTPTKMSSPPENRKNIIIITNYIEDEWKYWYVNSKQGIIHLFLSHLNINLPEIMYIFCRKLYNLISDFRTFRWSYCILHQIIIINCLLYLLYWIPSHFSNKWLTFSMLLSELYITYITCWNNDWISRFKQNVCNPDT